MNANRPSAGMLCRLLYTSKVAIEGPPAEQEGKVRSIATGAAARNRDRAVTGMLLLVSETFIQILEGATEDVEQTFEEICCDMRHSHVALVDFISVGTRIFNDWDMAFLSDGPDAKVECRADLAEIGLVVGLNARETVRQMRELLDRHAG